MSYGGRGGHWGGRGNARRGAYGNNWQQSQQGWSNNQGQGFGAPSYGQGNWSQGGQGGADGQGLMGPVPTGNAYQGYGGGQGNTFQSYGGGGRGRGRGRRDRRETHRCELPPDSSMDGSEEGGEGSQSGGRERPPPGLRGRDIGMWYAKRSQARKEREQKQNRPTVSMDRRQEHQIRQLLTDLKDSDDTPPATSHSGMSASSSATTPMHLPGGGKSRKLQSDRGFDEEEDQTAKRPSSGAGAAWDSTGQQGKSQTRFVYQDKQTDMFPESSEPPDNWEVLAGEEETEEKKGDGSFFVEVVPPGGASNLPLKEEEDMEEEEVPSVAGVVQYLRSHGDYPYASEEPEADFASSVPQSENPTLDKEMQETSRKLLNNPQFTKMLEFRHKLPSYEMKETLVSAVQENQVLVVSGETGCGKTTQVPQFILDDYIERGLGSQCRLICTQPRRISAISVAERVAAERCDRVNDSQQSSVGYQIRLEAKRPRSQGSILFCTTGIVLKFLESDPKLQRATHVIIDEIHERDLQSDFLMIILKDLLAVRRDLKVILMSATLNAEMFSHYFNDCPMLNIPGYTFPVKEYLLENIIEMTGYRLREGNTGFRGRKRDTQKDREERENYMVWLRTLIGRYDMKTIEVLNKFDYSCIDLDLIQHIIHYICTQMEDGAILVFVPGWEEIKKLNEMIQKTAQSRSGSLRVIPLHSLMPTVNQREIFDRPPPGVRKIVIATNIAETSITIDDVVFVIDCGKIKVKDFNPDMNLTSLEPQWVSKANAKQRRGRAGRVQPGHCFHLYTEFRYQLCRDYLPPEMLRTRLEELCLQIKLLKLGRIVPFIGKAMQHPSMEAITHAVDTLRELNALDHDENLLPLGYHLARMPVEPHTGKMILFGAMFCCLDPILTVAASLSFKDAFTVPLGKEAEADKARKRLARGSKSDHIMLINAFSGWEENQKRGQSGQFCWENFLSDNTLRMLRDMKKQLAELLHDTGFVASRNPKDGPANINSDKSSLIRAVLCAGLYPNVAQVTKVHKPGHKRPGGVAMTMKDDSRVAVHPKSVNSEESFFESKWMVFYYKLKTTKVYIHDCTMVSPYPLLFFGGEIKILRDQGTELVSVDDWVIFKASASTAQVVKELRQQLDKLLTRKITRPGPTSWDNSTSEGPLMAAIADLLCTEEAGQSMGGSIGYPPEGQ
ncbi:ATP-dependent DNA/RNA helicase DHX36 [Aplysia californica]|uniref:ATP-dependent DNA/RNA helicase DHX36 n=1 Tax=Aplysia californica TaxID=6500 RepID=A0ABM1AC89_APLCA|nr:ATP-dependent DNA/RNA helicase DHX36 [Aplysia californica]XP_012944943.1 ATP-dependent DNA/RNA helicase DHX36 [Aplysia californica]